MSRFIPLNHGHSTVVDDDMFFYLSRWKWRFTKGYVVRSEGRKTVYMHRIVANTPEDQFTDHINGDRLDNRRANLRICDTSQNDCNRGKIQRPTTSRFKGLTWNVKLQKWNVRIRKNNQRYCIGHFADEIDAALAYDDAALKHHGEFARLNFPDRRKAA